MKECKTTKNIYNPKILGIWLPVLILPCTVVLIKLLNLSVDISKAVEMGEMSSYLFFIVSCDNMYKVLCTATICLINTNFLLIYEYGQIDYSNLLLVCRRLKFMISI